MGEQKIDERTFHFALKVVGLYKYLTMKQREYVLSKQLLRCGTSIGANVSEAQSAQSKKDFVSKMAISSKEAYETKYWLRLLEATGYLGSYKGRGIKNDIEVIIRILSKILITTKKNMQNV